MIYVATVYFTEDIENCMSSARAVEIEAPDVALPEASRANRATMHGVEVIVEEIIHSRMAQGHGAGYSEAIRLDAVTDGLSVENSSYGRRRRGSSVGLTLADPDAVLGSTLPYSA